MRGRRRQFTSVRRLRLRLISLARQHPAFPSLPPAIKEAVEWVEGFCDKSIVPIGSDRMSAWVRILDYHHRSGTVPPIFLLTGTLLTAASESMNWTDVTWHLDRWDALKITSPCFDRHPRNLPAALRRDATCKQLVAAVLRGDDSLAPLALADYLEERPKGIPQVWLAHLRDHTRHVAGCWVTDSLQGKQ